MDKRAKVFSDALIKLTRYSIQVKRYYGMRDLPYQRERSSYLAAKRVFVPDTKPSKPPRI